MMEFLQQFVQDYYLLVGRYIFVLLIFLLFIEIKRLLFYREKQNRLLMMLDIDNGKQRYPITQYEVTIGRSSYCDIVLAVPYISRQHAVLAMGDDGYWRITDTKSKGGVFVNGEVANEDTKITIGDTINLGGLVITFTPATIIDIREFEKSIEKKEKKWKTKIKNKINFIGRKTGSYTKAIVYLNIFQILAGIQIYRTVEEEFRSDILLCFGGLFVIPWLFMIVAKSLSIKNLGAEAAAFFLTTIGFCVIASANPGDLFKQLMAVILGIVFYSIMCVILKAPRQIMKFRRYAAMLSIGILLFNLVFGTNINGQRNWVVIGPLAMQPSELVKVLFIFASSATLDWLYKAKNLRNLVVYATSCVGLLFLMGDFGTALIFFATFIILMFLTTGDIKAILSVCTAAGSGGLIVLGFKPYIIERFSTWRNVWAHIYDSGSQQARALIAVASGGMLGLGAGNGFSRFIFASDSDIVIAMIIEEWGLLIAIMVASVYIFFMVSAIRSHKTARSSYYIIAALATASLFLVQASLNIFGALDVLPFTGVTLPFVSNGGSSMLGSWGLLSFITATLNYAKPKENKATAPVYIKE